MSVSNQVSKNIIAGDGTTTVFSYTFALPLSSDGSDIYFFVVDASGNITQITTNFSLNIGASQFTYPVVGGITPLAPGVNALPAGWQIVALRSEQLVQTLNLATQGPFPAASIMAALDYLTFVTQQLQEQLNRAVLLPVNTPNNNLSPVIAPTDGVLITYRDTYANLVTIAAAHPTTPFFAYATDQLQLYFYTGNILVGTGGFIAVP